MKLWPQSQNNLSAWVIPGLWKEGDLWTLVGLLVEAEVCRVVGGAVPEAVVHDRVAVHERVLGTVQKHNYFAEI